MLQRPYLRQHVGKGYPGDFCIVRGLGAQPVAVRKAKEPAEPQICVGGDGTHSFDDFIDASRRDADFFCKAILADSQRGEKFFLQQLARGYERKRPCSKLVGRPL